MKNSHFHYTRTLLLVLVSLVAIQLAQAHNGHGTFESVVGHIHADPADRYGGSPLEESEVSAGWHPVVHGTSGLIGHWRLDEGSGSTTADASPSGNAGSLVNGPVWTTGKVGNALLFDGVDDYVDIGDVPSFDFAANPFSLTGWIRTTAANNTYVLSKRPACGYGNFYDVMVSSGRVRFEMDQSNSGNYLSLASTVTVNDGAFHHFAVTRNGPTVQLYVDGALAATKTAALTHNLSNAASLRIGYTPCTIYARDKHFLGTIDEVRVYNRALTASEVSKIYNSTTPPPPDTAPPSTPANVTATPVSASQIDLSWAASADNVGVVGYRVYRDAAHVASPAGTGYADGGLAPATTYTYTVSAVDAAGNESAPSSPVTASTASLAQVGQWSAPMNWPLVAIHMILAHTGEILMWDGEPLDGGSSMRVWNPTTDTFTAVPVANNAFCAGQTQLADGTLLVFGGHAGFFHGTKDINLFHPVTKTWDPPPFPQMNYARWYGTATTLPDGRVLLTSGSTNCATCFATIPEIFDPATKTVTRLMGANLALPFYPWMFVLPDGKVLYAGSDQVGSDTKVLDINTQTWTTVDARTLEAGSAVMYEPGKVMKTGINTYTLDMTQASPAWQQTQSMNLPRTLDHNLVILPTGDVLVVGGSSNGSAVFQAEVWSPVTRTWTRLVPQSKPRQYHSTALLLPDGRILSAGSGRGAPSDQLNAEIYAPGYLFKGPRPTITSAPQSVQYNSIFSVTTPNASSIAKVTLVRPAAVTHSFDHNQRFVNLPFTVSGNTLDVRAPVDANTAPPGYYMLFIIDSNGVPSVAAFIKMQ